MSEPLPKSVTIRLFARFQVIYTHKWTSAVPAGKIYDLAVEEWSERLAGLTVEQIKNGIDNLPSEWMPTPLQFKDLCLGTNKDLTHASGAYKLFEKPKGIEMSKELKEEYRNKGRDILRGIKESLK